MKKVLFYLFTLLISTNIVFAEHLDNEMNVMSFNIRMSTIGDSDHRREYYRLFITFIICSFHDRFLMESLILRGDRSSSI